MKLEIKTEKFKTLIGKAVKGSGRLAPFPKTNIVGLSFKDNTLTLTTTDNVNTVVIKDNSVTNITPNELVGYWAVNSDLLSKLVSKTTANIITLEDKGNELLFVGNGKYSLPLIVDSEANPLVIDTTELDNTIFNSNVSVPTTQLKAINFYNKPSVAKTIETPYLAGYFFDTDCVITFNMVTACVNNLHVVDNKLLLPSSFVDLFNILDDESTTLSTQNSVVKVVSGNITIYSTLLENIDKFPSNALKKIIKEEFPAECKISKDELFKALDRISLFISEKDVNLVNLEFSDKLKISSKNGTGNEFIDFVTNNNPINFIKSVDLVDLRTQLQTQLSEEITILYGNDRSLMIKTEDIYQLIPFMVANND